MSFFYIFSFLCICSCCFILSSSLLSLCLFSFFFFYLSGDHRDLHVLTHSFPTRRSSDLSRPWGRMTMRWNKGNIGLAMAAVAATAAAAVPSAMAQRDPAYEQARASGEVGEQPDGYLGFVTTPNAQVRRSEEHTSELQSLMRISYAVFCLKKKNKKQ